MIAISCIGNGEDRDIEKGAQRYICDLIKLVYLAPDIIEAIIEGRIPAGLTLDRLKKKFSMEWSKQRQLLNIPT